MGRGCYVSWGQKGCLYGWEDTQNCSQDSLCGEEPRVAHLPSRAFQGSPLSPDPRSFLLETSIASGDLSSPPHQQGLTCVAQQCKVSLCL